MKLFNQSDKYPCPDYDAPCFDALLKRVDQHLKQKTAAVDAHRLDGYPYSRDIATSLRRLEYQFLAVVAATL